MLKTELTQVRYWTSRPNQQEVHSCFKVWFSVYNEGTNSETPTGTALRIHNKCRRVQISLVIPLGLGFHLLYPYPKTAFILKFGALLSRPLWCWCWFCARVWSERWRLTYWGLQQWQQFLERRYLATQALLSPPHPRPFPGASDHSRLLQQARRAGWPPRRPVVPAASAETSPPLTWIWTPANPHFHQWNKLITLQTLIAFQTLIACQTLKQRLTWFLRHLLVSRCRNRVRSAYEISSRSRPCCCSNGWSSSKNSTDTIKLTPFCNRKSQMRNTRNSS